MHKETQSGVAVEEEAGEGVGTRGWVPPRQLVAVVPRGSRVVVGEGVGEGQARGLSEHIGASRERIRR